MEQRQLDVEALSAEVVDAAFHIHRDLGPGLLESVYEAVLARALEKRGLLAQRQLPVSFEYDGVLFQDGLRLDLLINQRLVVELKSLEGLSKAHYKQVLSYLRLMQLPLGLLINFGAGTFKDGIHRIVNNHRAGPESRLRINQQ
jgi:GxxExxY protein